MVISDEASRRGFYVTYKQNRCSKQTAISGLYSATYVARAMKKLVCTMNTFTTVAHVRYGFARS